MAGLSSATAKALRIMVTGAGSGIGKGLCEHFAKAGHIVAASDANLESAQEVADGIVKKGGKAEGFRLDVCDRDAAKNVLRAMGGVDVLVNNAGLQYLSKIEEYPEDKFRLLVDVMLTGPAILISECLPRFREQNFGRIINIGSIHAVVASPYKSAYVAAKHGMLGLSKVVALETGDVDVTINSVCPSYVWTPLVSNQVADTAKLRGITTEEVVQEVMLKPMPKKAFIGLDELAGTCEFLMSDAAKNITGQAICVDGGWVAH